MRQYTEKLREAIAKVRGRATSPTSSLAPPSPSEGFDEFAAGPAWSALTDSGLSLDLDDCDRALGEPAAGTRANGESMMSLIAAWASEEGFDEHAADADRTHRQGAVPAQPARTTPTTVRASRLAVPEGQSFRTDRSKTDRELHLFDCIEGPMCRRVPGRPERARLHAGGARGRTSRGGAAHPPRTTRCRRSWARSAITSARTPVSEPTSTSRWPSARSSASSWISEQQPVMFPTMSPTGTKVAIIGAGPAGLAAAQELGYAGFGVTIFEQFPYPGGMVGGAIPAYRLPQAKIDRTWPSSMSWVSRSATTALPASTSPCPTSATTATRSSSSLSGPSSPSARPRGRGQRGRHGRITFLRSVREERPMPIGARVGVIGAGDTAMDCVRSALRVGASDVSLIYRRTIDQMPADPEEIHACIEEGINIIELAKPSALEVSEDGKLTAHGGTRTEYRGDRDASGRKIPFDVPDSEFEIPLDTIILAISQHSMLGLLRRRDPRGIRPRLHRRRPETFETSIPGVYAGGDVAAHGPSSIVKAASTARRPRLPSSPPGDARASRSPRDAGPNSTCTRWSCAVRSPRVPDAHRAHPGRRARGHSTRP